MIDFSQLKNMCASKKFSEGVIIIREGDTSPYCMYIILKGTVAVYKHYGQPDELLVATLVPGEFFGEMSLFLLQPRSATVIALEQVIALEINQLNAYEIIENHSEISLFMIKTLCTRINELNQKMKVRTRIQEGRTI